MPIIMMLCLKTHSSGSQESGSIASSHSRVHGNRGNNRSYVSAQATLNSDVVASDRQTLPAVHHCTASPINEDAQRTDAQRTSGRLLKYVG